MRLFLLLLSMLPPISSNENRIPAGVLNNGVLTIAIDAREGTWYPDSDTMPGIPAYAFGEAGKRGGRGHGRLLLRMALSL